MAQTKITIRYEDGGLYVHPHHHARHQTQVKKLIDSNIYIDEEPRKQIIRIDTRIALFGLVISIKQRDKAEPKSNRIITIVSVNVEELTKTKANT